MSSGYGSLRSGDVYKSLTERKKGGRKGEKGRREGKGKEGVGRG